MPKQPTAKEIVEEYFFLKEEQKELIIDYAKSKVDEACKKQRKACARYMEHNKILFSGQLNNAPQPKIKYE